MRKILLTTTALVALGGVSAASALDISGYQRFSYSSWDDTLSDEDAGANDSGFYDRNRLNLSHSITSDNGLTVSGYYRIQNLTEAYNDISVPDTLVSSKVPPTLVFDVSLYVNS
ncbi:MAG: hypothetical protein ISQ37_06180 [Candidatus Puniceispirillum sp.]|nr:hypothetical protein [Candidatus Puniceispirillum sp.]